MTKKIWRIIKIEKKRGPAKGLSLCLELPNNKAMCVLQGLSSCLERLNVEVVQFRGEQFLDRIDEV